MGCTGLREIVTVPDSGIGPLLQISGSKTGLEPDVRHLLSWGCIGENFAMLVMILHKPGTTRLRSSGKSYPCVSHGPNGLVESLFDHSITTLYPT